MNTFLKVVCKMLDTAFLGLLVLVVLGCLYAAGYGVDGIVGTIRDGIGQLAMLF